MKTYTAVDRTGLTLSLLCVIHCLFLPTLGTALPIIGVWSEVEWIHKALVLLAVPVGISLITTKAQPLIRFFALLGLGLLFSGAFLEVFHDFETIITVMGALMLGFAHMLRLLHISHSH